MFMLILVVKFESDYPQNYTNTLNSVLLILLSFTCIMTPKKFECANFH